MLRATLSLIVDRLLPGLLLDDHYLSEGQQLKCSPVPSFSWLAQEVDSSAVFNRLFLVDLLVIAAFWAIAALTATLG